MASATMARIIVMTGATAGIGAEALTHLARPGTRILIGARATSATPPESEVEVLPLDLNSLAAVREFAATVLEMLAGAPIDALVLNAGISRRTATHSADGFEQTFTVNHLAHYLLARLLLPAVAEGGRIVLTTSDTHDPRLMWSAPTKLEIDAWASGEAPASRVYSASKLANLLTAEGLLLLPEVTQKRIIVIAYNPGFTPGTGLMRGMPPAGRVILRGLRPIFAVISRFKPILHMGTVEHAGAVLADLVDGTATPPAGHIYASLAKGTLTYPEPSELAQDPRARDELWARSAEFVDLPVH